MKMTHAIQTPFFSAGTALPIPPRFEGFGTSIRHAKPVETRAPGRFDIQDQEGRLPEILCRVVLGLCLAYTFVACLLQLAAS